MHWCVPLRRCVVTETISYADLVAAWIAHLAEHAAVLERWYPQLNTQRAIAAGRSWWARYFPEPEGQETRVSTGSQHQTLEVPQNDLAVRLWKGPLRVILEERAGENGVEFGGEPLPLELSEAKTVVNREARFLVGDLVEFPLFTLIFRGNPDAYGEYEELAFDPEGSPYLGTSVTRNGTTTRDDLPALPENMTGMRFQLLLNLSRGAFHALGDHVFTSSRSIAQAPGVQTSAGLLSARGMIYSGSFGRASRGTSDGWWTIVTNSWGVLRRNNTLAQCVTTGAGLANLRSSYPVTPGWSCSPSTIFLSHYMLNEQANGSYGGGSVRRTMGWDDKVSPLHEIYQGVDKATLLESLGAETESLGDLIQQLKDGIDPLLPKFQGSESIGVQTVSETRAAFGSPQQAQFPPPPRNREAHPENPTQVSWSDMPSAVARSLEQKQEDPHQLAMYVAQRLRGVFSRYAAGLRPRSEGRRRPASTADAAEWNVLRDLRSRLLQKASQVLYELERLTATDAWRRVPVMPELVYHRLLPSTAHRDERRPTPNRPAGRVLQGFNGSRQSLFRFLRARRRRLDRLEPDEGAILGGFDSVTVDLSETTATRDWTLTDINVVSLNGHEWAIVRLFRADKLLGEESLPRQGHMTAWDPLSGQEIEIPDEVAERGALYVHEATGSLKRWRHDERGYSQFGCKPFRFVRLNGNRLTIGASRNRRNISMTQPAIAANGSPSNGGSTKPFMWLWRLGGEGNQVKEAHASLDGWPRIRVYPSLNSGAARQALGPAEHYHDRAVPFPTMHEASESGGFVSWQTMHDRKEALRRTAYAEFREDGSERAQAFSIGLKDPSGT